MKKLVVLLFLILCLPSPVSAEFLGELDLGADLTFYLNTHNAVDGVATDADSVPTYRIYEEETGTAIANGTMTILDDANTVGFYSEQVTLSGVTGYENGKSYGIYVSATVNGREGTVTKTFRIKPYVEGNLTLEAATRIFLSVLTGKSTRTANGANWDIKFRDIADTKYRLEVTSDSTGQRITITTRDGS